MLCILSRVAQICSKFITKAYHIELTICRPLKKGVGRFHGILHILPHHFVQFVPTFQFQVLYNPVKLTRKSLGYPQCGRQLLDKGILSIIRFVKIPAARLTHSNLIFFQLG